MATPNTPTVDELLVDYSRPKVLGLDRLGIDAFGKQKVVLEKSLFHGLFTFDVPSSSWLEYFGTGGLLTSLTEQLSIVRASSIDSELVLKSGTTIGNITFLRSKVHSRYQPNRGHLYCSSIFVDTPTLLGKASWGMFTVDNGTYFEVEGNGTNYLLYACVKSLGIVTLRYDITSLLPVGFDISKGNLYDIQMQWRGVGDFKFFINKSLIFSSDVLGTRSKLSIANPALPCSYLVENMGAEYIIRGGCVDITSEGGAEGSLTYTSEKSGTVGASTGSGSATLGYRIPSTYNGVSFTRDALFKRMTGFARDEAQYSIFVSRSIATPNVNALTWIENSNNKNQFIVGGSGSALDTAFQLDRPFFKEIYHTRHERDIAFVLGAIDDIDLVLVAGDVLVAMIRTDANTSTSGITLEFGVEI